MITLAAGGTLQGVAGAATSVTYTLHGLELSSTGVETYKKLAQGQLPAAAGVLYTVPALTTAFVKTVSLANTTGAPVNVTLYVDGAAAANQIASLPIPANGEAVWTQDGWKLYDANGYLLTAPIQGDGSTLEVVNGLAREKDGGTTNAKLANMAQATIKGRAAGAGTGAPVDLSGTQATAILDVATTALKGLMSSADKVKLNGAYVDAVADLGADPTGAVDATTLIQNGLNAMTSGGRLYFPQGTYKITANITISHPVIICGAGRAISVISTTSATATMFTIIAGGQGAGFEQIRLIGATAGTRTAGYAVDFGALANVYMQQCDILFQWSGVHSSGALQFLDDINIREGGANAINGQGVLVDSTGDRYLRRLTMDQGSNPTGYADVRINECSSCVITDCNLIHGNIALDITATAGAGHAIASVDCVNCFFDTSVVGCRVNCATASDTVQRVMFVRCWFSTHTTAGAQIQHANVNSVDFVSCEFYQCPFGLDVSAATEWAVRASRFAGNTTNAIRTAAGATHSFAITDNVIGNVAGFGANAQGINIQAGTYKRYQILDNRGLDTNTTPGLIDLGTVSATDQKVVQNNVGALVNGAIATLAGTVAIPATTETLVLAARVMANAVSTGQAFRFKAVVITAGANVTTWRTRVGAVGTVAGDATVADIVVTAAGFANGRSTYEGLLTVRSLGAPGSCEAEGHAITSTAANAAAAAQTTAAAAATSAITTTAPWFIDITVASPTSTATAVAAVIEAL